MSWRPTAVETFMEVARVVAKRSTCRRRQVGCVLVNGRHHIVGVGFNGVPKGHPHCTDVPCPGAGLPSGQGLDLCEAIHAEANALIQCERPFEIWGAICTTAPCVHCVKLLLNTSCQVIWYAEDYPHSDLASSLWRRAASGRVWEKVNY